MLRRGVAICLGVWAALAAPAAFAQPVAPLPPVAGVPDPAPGNPLPTDGLMAPAPAVPPRTAYQRPALPPADPDFPPDPRDTPGLGIPDGTNIPVPVGVRIFRLAPRYGRLNNYASEKLPDGSQRYVFTSGLIVNVSGAADQPGMEFATDNAVIWVRGEKVDNITGGFEVGEENGRQIEMYLTGSVVVRTVSQGPGLGGQPFLQTLRADQVYYDVSRSKAVALAGELEVNNPKVPDGVFLKGKEIRRLDRDNWEVLNGSIFSSKLPADPGIRFDSPRVTMQEQRVIRTNIFGIPYRDFQGRELEGWERTLTIRNSVTRVFDVPVFYWPYFRTDVTEPFGPLVSIGAGQDRIFGTQFYSTWDVYKILALKPPPGHKWRLHLDYLSDRGPAAGTDYYYNVPSLPPDPDGPLLTEGKGFARLYALNDGGVDQIGGGRGEEPVHPAVRGRALWRHQQEFLEGLYFQGQAAYLSDKNFLEQFYKQEFDLGPNQETFAYATYQRDNLWASGLVMPKVGREWESQTMWLPRLDGAVVGQSFWDTLVYSARANGAYALSRPAEINPLPVLPTDRRTDTGRFDVAQELSLPFDLGPLKLAPYGILDLAYYTRDLTGEDRGRAVGGGGLRGNLPLARLYEDAASELLNVRGLYHKVTVGGNYYYARSSTPYTNLPLLDRLDDDSTDRTYRNSRPFQTQFVPGPAGIALATSPLFDQQKYAIRRLVEDRVDTLDSINVLQMDVRQRLQTKRGYPGLEHTVDWITLDLSGSYFPQPDRDNFGKSFAFLEYNGLWNIGDRVSVLSAGWFDPFDDGARYWNLGVNLDRPNRTNFYLGYRQTDPLNSKAVTASLGYQLSKRYATNLGVSYDFGVQRALSNSFSLTRTGSDVTITLGFTYNALVNNFGVTFMVVPNLLSSLGFGGFAPAALNGPR